MRWNFNQSESINGYYNDIKTDKKKYSRFYAYWVNRRYLILGILAATVVPKYVDLTAEAHTATLEAVKGSLEGASALVYSKSIISGNQKDSSATIILNDGDPLTIAFGYPVVPRSPEDYWRRLINLGDDFVISANNTGAILTIYPASMDEPDSSTSPCIVTFKGASSEDVAPEINIFECI